MKYNWYRIGSPRSRLRKRKKGGLTIAPYQGVYPRYNSLKVYHSSTVNRYRNEGPLWGGLRRAWVGYVIAKSQVDFEKMRKYAIVIQKFERRLNIEINEFPELGLYASGYFENKEEYEDSKLAVIDPFTNEKKKDAKEDEDDYREVNFDSL
ncbi:MAG: hypothetical protein ACR2IS_11175 [Nitrososphaeraceae archaeon]